MVGSEAPYEGVAINGVQNICEVLESLQKTRELKELIRQRLSEFEELGRVGAASFDFKPFLNLSLKASLKSEVAFCLSTANSSAISGLKFQKALEDKALESIDVEDLAELLRRAEVRFYERKASYIKEALRNFSLVEDALKLNSYEARKALVSDVKGMGYKEASHLLRNVGRKDIAILDRHILRFLHTFGYIDCVPNHVSQKEYLRFERVFSIIGSSLGMNLAELDLYLWFKATGKVLK
ncbi:MAG: N-glycosylase/DNA lyase [Candidatus Bathyarchaeia archaeon]